MVCNSNTPKRKRPGFRKLLINLEHYDNDAEPHAPWIEIYSDGSGVIRTDPENVLFEFDTLKDLEKHLATLPYCEEGFQYGEMESK